MKPTTPSVLDLSPTEELKLMQVWWDDFAATPEDVPVTEWQKSELAGRKENLKKHPDSTLDGEAVKRGARALEASSP